MAQSASNYWPVPIDDVIGYIEMSGPQPTPDVQLVFRDTVGQQLTLRLRRIAADNLLQRLQAGPDKAPEPKPEGLGQP